MEVHHEWRPDLLLIDAQMPGIGGVETIRRPRAAGFTTRILLVTASGLSEMRDAGLAAGADDVLFRPLAESDLLSQIAHLLGVQYDYEAEDPHRSTAAIGNAGVPSLTHLVAALPDELFKGLMDAARGARAIRVEEMATLVAERCPAAAAAIRALAKDFKYDAIVAAMREARDL